MSKVIIVIFIFLVIGGLMIKYDTDKEGGSFVFRFWGWIKQLGSNTQGVTTHAISDYQWLPNMSNSTP